MTGLNMSMYSPSFSKAMMRLFTPIMFAAMPTQPSLWAISVSRRSCAVLRSSAVAASAFWARKTSALHISRIMAFLLNLMLRSKKAGLRVGEARVERLSRLNAEHIVGAHHVEGVHVRMIDVQLCRNACGAQPLEIADGLGVEWLARARQRKGGGEGGKNPASRAGAA